MRELRERKGMSPERLAVAIADFAREQGPSWAHGTVDAYTIRRAEGNPRRGRLGAVPGVRVQYVLATFFGTTPEQIWQPGAQMEIAA